VCIKRYTTPLIVGVFVTRFHDQLPADLYHWIGKKGIGEGGLNNGN
jgi:hypothetical protein